jgi:hypothetical protein
MCIYISNDLITKIDLCRTAKNAFELRRAHHTSCFHLLSNVIVPFDLIKQIVQFLKSTNISAGQIMVAWRMKQHCM